MLINFINPNTSTSELSGTTQTGDVIVDVDIPILISGYSDSNSLSSFDLAIQDPTGGAATTLQIQFDGDMGASLPQAAIDDLNATLEAGVADPYNIPKFADVSVPNGYLEAPTLYKITGIRIS